MPQYPYCAQTGACSPYPPGGGGGGSSSSQLQPTAASSPVSDGAKVSVNHDYQGSKKQFCDHQSDMAFWEHILPYGSVLLGGDYKPSAVVGATAEVAKDQVIDWAAKSTAVLSTVRSWTGIPMSVTSKVLKIAGWTGTAYMLYDATKAMQNEYAACMEN